MGLGPNRILPNCACWPNLDVAIRQEVQVLSAAFQVRPGFGFLRDFEQGNALATPERYFPGTTGTVLLGVRLIRDELEANPSWGTNGIVGVMAHEFAHILQFQHGAIAPGKPMELSADFMAGWLMGLKSLGRVPGTRPDVVAASVYRLGDYEEEDPDHHGTPAERSAAVGAGHAAATQQGVFHVQPAFALSRQISGL
jgi:hypothetical protein